MVFCAALDIGRGVNRTKDAEVVRGTGRKGEMVRKRKSVAALRNKPNRSYLNTTVALLTIPFIQTSLRNYDKRRIWPQYDSVKKVFRARLRKRHACALGGCCQFRATSSIIPITKKEKS